MMRIVIAPDKFKGSLPAAQVAAAIAAGLRAGLTKPAPPGAELVTIPVADGGEGTVDAAVAAGFERVPVTAAGPAGEPVRASYARRGEVAVVELACVCGLVRLPGGRRRAAHRVELRRGRGAAGRARRGRVPDRPRRRRQRQHRRRCRPAPGARRAGARCPGRAGRPGRGGAA